jgi:hypothetical protein
MFLVVLAYSLIQSCAVSSVSFVVPKYLNTFSALKAPTRFSSPYPGFMSLIKAVLPVKVSQRVKMSTTSGQPPRRVIPRPPSTGIYFLKLSNGVTLGLRLNIFGDEPSCVLAIGTDNETRYSSYSCTWGQPISSLSKGRLLHIKAAPAGFLVWFSSEDDSVRLALSSVDPSLPEYNYPNKMRSVTEDDALDVLPPLVVVLSRLTVLATSLHMCAEDLFKSSVDKYSLRLGRRLQRFFTPASYILTITEGSRYTSLLYSMHESQKSIKLCMVFRNVLKSEDGTLRPQKNCLAAIADMFLFSTDLGILRVEQVELYWSGGYEPLLVCSDSRLVEMLNTRLGHSAESLKFMWRQETSELYLIQGSRGPVLCKKSNW